MREALMMAGFAFFALGMVAFARAVYVEGLDQTDDCEDPQRVNEVVLSVLAGGVLILIAGPFFVAALLAA